MNNQAYLDLAAVSIVHNHVKNINHVETPWEFWDAQLPVNTPMTILLQAYPSPGVQKWLGAAWHRIKARWSSNSLELETRNSAFDTVYLLPYGSTWLEDAKDMKRKGVRVVVLDPGELTWINKEGVARRWALGQEWDTFECLRMQVPRKTPERREASSLLNKVLSIFKRTVSLKPAT